VKNVAILSAVFIILTFNAITSGAATLRVPSEFTTIQSGIDAAVDGDTVLVAEGTYKGDGNRDIDFTGKALTLLSENGPEVTIIIPEGDPNNHHRGFYFHSGETHRSIVDGFTIWRGFSTGSGGGGGICCDTASPVIRNCTIADCHSDSGGGIACRDSYPSIEYCLIIDNTVSTPGGNFGGGIFCYSSFPLIKNCTISGNSASGGTSSCGGGIYCAYGSTTLLNCLITGNTASGGQYRDDGGGIYCSGSSPTIMNCTVTENDGSGSRGGGLYGTNSYPNIINCIFWNNSGDEITTFYRDPIIIYSDIQGGWEGEGNIDADPLFTDPGSGDYSLLPDSPCIDAGELYSRLDLDGTINDMGAWGGMGEMPEGVIGGYISGILPISGSPYIVSENLVIETADTLTVEPGVEFLFHTNSRIIVFGELFADGAMENPVTVNRFLEWDVGGGIVFAAGDGSLSNCIIEHCRNIDGGGIRCLYGSSPDISNCLITGNSSMGGEYFQGGGGIYISDSSPTISNSTITGNAAERNGGGIYCTDFASPTITSCLITGNSAGQYGGGIYCTSDSSPTIVACSITENISNDDGGGIYCYKSSSTIRNSILAMNTAKDDGGGIYFGYSWALVITNCMIYGNRASGYYHACGGGIYCYQSTPAIKNSTLVENTAEDEGGGICCDNSAPTITNCILWDDIPQEIYSSSGSPSVTFSDIGGGWAGEGNIDSDPIFLNPGNNDFHLMGISPCVDTGTDAGVYIDIDEDPRPQGQGFDMGADEVILEGPVLVIQPVSFHEIAEYGGYLENDTLLICNIGTEDLEYSVIPGSESWLSLDGDLHGIIQPDENTSVFLQFDISILEGGIYTDTISVLSNDPVRPSLNIQVRLDVLSEGTIRVPENCGTIQEAIDLALDGATVLVADGTYTGYGNRDIDFSGKAITVMSVNGASLTVIDCEDMERGFYFRNGEGSDSRLDDITIKNGSAGSLSGGGIYCHFGSSPTISNCIITGNSAYHGNGGGICCFNGSSPIITNCTITGNESSGSYNDGGGIYCSSSSPFVANCFITENWASGEYGGGGGICSSLYASPTITNCTITENSAEYGGGGVACDGSAQTLIANCAINGNVTAEIGGGIYCTWNSQLLVQNCLISNNSAQDYGGGIYCSDATPTFVNCSISLNQAGHSGDGIYVSSSYPNITNSILWNNSGQEIFVDSGMPAVTYSDIDGGWTGEGNITDDPLFIDPSNGDFHLSLLSPCINAGTDAGVYDDMDGEERPNGAGFDIGVDEYYQAGALEVFLFNCPDTVSTGELLIFTTGVLNSGTVAASFDEATLDISGPVTITRPLYSGPSIEIAPGDHLQSGVSLAVPGNAFTGSYILTIRIYLAAEQVSSAAFHVEVVE